MRLAIVHDWLNQYGGAERVLETLHDLYPEAPIYTAFYEPRALPQRYRSWEIRTTFLQGIPLSRRYHQLFLPLYPLAFQGLDLSAYDVVISNSSGFCHGVPTTPSTLHINYCLTPPRYLWNPDQYLRRERLAPALQLLLRPLLTWLRRWDARVAQRVDYFVAISQAVVERIRNCYGREASLLYPPVETGRFQPAPPSQMEDYYLVVGRLVPYKRIDLAVAACSRMGLPLLVVGEGRDRRALEALAGPTVRFLGRLPEEETAHLMGRCRALLFPGEEDFGLTPVEAQAAGRPVIAYAAGGALDTVIDGQTGVLFSEPTVESLAQAIARSERLAFDGETLQQHARRFDSGVFREAFSAFVAEKVAQHTAQERARASL